MPYMTDIISGDTANINTDSPFFNGLEGFLFSCRCIEYFLRHIFQFIPFLNQSAIFVGVVVGFLNVCTYTPRRLRLAASISSLI
jgi:hypothetical protein